MQKDNPSTGRPSQNDIASRAYLLWKQAGSPTGQDLGFWLQAEAQLSNIVPIRTEPLPEVKTKPKVMAVQPSPPPSGNQGRPAQNLSGSPKGAKSALDHPSASSKKAEIPKVTGAKGKSTSSNTRMSSSRPT